ncbi:MAG: hypothetical protein WCJ97_11005 [Phycisphaerae bacterium]
MAHLTASKLMLASVGLIFLLLGSGCGLFGERKPEDLMPGSTEAVVTGYSPNQRTIYLDTDHGALIGWWDNLTIMYYGTERFKSLPLKPGHKIRFRGVQTDKEIYLTIIYLPTEGT